MQITLTQSEIEVGIKMYIASRGIQVDGRHISSDFTATRKNNIGISVEVDLGEDTKFMPPQAHSPTTESSNVSVMPNRSGGVSARRTPSSKVNEDAVHVKQPEPKPEPVKAEEPEAKEEKVEADEPAPKPATTTPGEKVSTVGEDTPVPVEEPEPIKPEPEGAAPAETEGKEEPAPAEEPQTEASSLFGGNDAKESKPAPSNPFADSSNDTTQEAPKKRNSIFGN